MSEPGRLIIVDNVVRGGRIIDDASRTPAFAACGAEPNAGGERRVDATTIQTVGSKGYDGFTLAVVR